MYHLRKLKSLLLLLCFAVTAQAQLSNGKVYNFVNIGNAGKSMTYISENKLSIATTDNNDYKQLWYVEGDANNGYTLRSLANGYYLRSQNSANNTSWTTVKDIDNNCRFSCIAAGNGYTLRATNTTNDQHSMHYGAGTNSIVCWNSTANASQWTLTEVSLTEEELTANWEYVTSLRSGDIYQTALAALFTDNSCSELKPAYASYTKNQMMNDANYMKLSATLQKMVLKVLSGNWQETNYDTSKPVWESGYAKKYRVQLYEPYNNISAASKALSLNEHTNMNNPTGIFSGGREAIYVMVQGEIAEGASLYLDSYTGHNKLGTDHKKGIQLTEGLNIIPSEVVGNNYFINYVVETFDVSDGKRGHEAKARSLKNYVPLKIHIEGGYINGYYNKVGDALYEPDINADWEYIEARATQTDVTVLGKYMTLQFPLRDADTEGNKGLGTYLNELVKIEDVINSWDNVMMWERLLLGVLDENTVNAEAKQSPYSITDSKQVIEYTGNDTDFPAGYGDYYNIHGLAYGVGGSAYMYGSGDHSGYHYNTMGGIIQNMPTNAGSHWGPAHEIGHQHQNLLKIRKEMEVTNNLFSNVVLWYFGETTSRVNGTEGSLENILNNFNKEDGHYLTNNIWGMTQMYYKLFLYYHVLGHNPKFYPRLFEILRQDPSNGMAGTVDGEEAQLHIYKKMCQAAGEDLTEFFRAHGFLKPLDGFAIDDYGVSTFYMTQAQIDAAIAEVKSWNYKENVAVLFINDATGETIKSHKGDNLELYGETRVCAEVGGYASFEESITNASDLKFCMSGNNVIVNSGGGVGYAIFNEKGEIMSFSDKKTFTVSDECASALMCGEATMKIVNADNSVVVVENADEVSSKYALLGNLINKVDAELACVDGTNTQVGYYKQDVLNALETARNEAKEVYDNQDIQLYTVVYAKLYDEYCAVIHNKYNRVGIISGGTYRLKNRNNTSQWMSVNGENKVIGETSDESSSKQQWIFEAAGEDDTYYIKNASTSLYIGGAKKNEQVATQAEAKAYKLASVETGVWTLQCQDSNLQWLNHNGGTVLGWNDGNDHNSQWYITFKSVTQDAEKLHELNTLVQKTKELIGEMAEVTPTQKQTLQTTSSSSPFYLSTNACHNTLNGANDGQGLAGLLDEDAATFFHSDYNGHNVGTHYLQVDLGSVLNLSEYIFYYTTRDNGNNCPTTIEVWGSTDGTTFNDKLYTFDSGLPTEGKQTWESPMLTEVTGYRSLRFMVTAAEGGKKFFVMSRFGIAKCEATVQSMGGEYTAQGLTNDALISAYASIHNAQDKVKVGGFTSNELTSLYKELSPKYAALEVIYNNAKSAGYTTIKSQLSALIDETNTLINTCATFKVTTGEPLILSVTPGDGVNYLTAGPNSTASEGALSHLIDNESGTSFTSNWDSQTGNPYLQVQLPDEEKLSKFTFTFTARQGGGAPTPSIIVVSGSNDGSDFTPIRTFTKENDGFPDAASGVKWTSPEVKAETAYKYLRFTVTKSERSNSGANAPDGYYHFGISHFGVSTVSETVVTLLSTAGGATQEDVLAAYNQKAEAQAVYDMATTEAQLQKAIDKLQAQYNALEEAKNAAIDFTISSNIAGGGVRYQDVYYTTKLSAPSTLTTEALTAMQVDGYVAKSITINGTTISVVYNKVYTVTITGGEGEGRVTFGDDEYANDGTFDASQNSFTAADLTATDVEGYTKSEVTVNHETGAISVTYTLDRTTLGTLIGETNDLLQACSGFVNSDYVTDELRTNTSAAITAAIEANSKEELTYAEYTAAVTELQNAYNTLNTAKTSAEAEAAERTELKSQLSTLITETETLIASCYDNDVLKYVNSEFVTEETISAVRTLIEAAEVKCETPGTTATEYNASINELTTAKNNLATAITNAIAEAEERNGLKAQLLSLITETETLITSCYENDALKYVNSEFVTDASITEVRNAITTASEKCNDATTASEYNASISALTEVKEDLVAAIENADNEAKDRELLKAELRTLVNSTNSLMTLCGTVTFMEATADQNVELQTENPTGTGYLSANSTQSDEFSVAKLLDKDVNSQLDINTHFHSSWGVAATDYHHLQVYLGEGKSLAEFTFTYTTRNLGNSNTSPAPTVIEVYGSNDPNSFTDLLGTFTKDDNGLPAYSEAGASWTSPNIKPETSYEYIRFYVKESAGPGNNQFEGVYYFFAMSSFSLMSIGQPARYDVGLTAPGVRGVTEEMLKEVYLMNIEANNLLEGETANRDLETTIATLTTAYNNLESAYNTYVFDKSELGTLITQTRELVASCYEGETFKYTNSLHITENLVETTTSNADAAQQVFVNNVNEEQYSGALAQLKEAYANLQYAIECALFPVLLTADPASPALYIIKTKRDGDNLVLQYDEPTELFSVKTVVEKEPTQAFYFMKGDGSQVYIYPYMAGGKVLAANEVGNAAGTAFAMEKGSATYEQWVFVARADGYYNLQPTGTSTYLSNIYGTSHKMGFYGSSPDTDKGSLFKFESTTVEGSYYYLKLKDYYENQAKVAGSNIQGGEAVGYYPTDKANAYNSAYSNATDVLASATSTDEEYTNAYDALKAANEALVMNMPEEGKFYRFVSADTKNDRVEGVVYANPEDNKMYWSKGKETSDATAIWTIAPADNGTYHITNLHTGSSISKFISNDPTPLSESANAASFVSLSGDGQVKVVCNGTMHAQSGGAVVTWNTGANDASAWRIVEVEDMSLVKFALAIGQYRHAGLYLNYSVEIPENVKVYIAHTPDGDDETIIADELDGTILPARTAVIVKGNADTYNFKYTTSDYDGSDDLSANLLGGSAYLKYQQVAKDGNRCCVFGQKNGEVGLYKNWVRFTDANGTAAEDTNSDGKINEDNGTYFRISANKIYYEYEPVSTANASAFRFRFNNKAEGTTAIDELILGDDVVIYNLYGLRIVEIVEPGIYIINGKKTYVSEKMILNND